MPKQHKILIVDDQMGIRILLKETFSEEYQVELAENGNQAIKKVKQFQPSIILLDMKMPDLSGVETLHLIRELNITVPVILMSGFDEFDIINKTKGLEQVHYINKPFDLEEIKMMVKELLLKAKDSNHICSL
ncbi:MAG: response regulator [Firmicutes bacterium]|nr:response regulator [Bacillota bacterium]